MTKISRTLAVAVPLVFGLGVAGTAHAVAYTSIAPAESHITFGYTQMNVGMEGKFGQLQAKEFQFDTDAPENARVNLEVPLASVDSGSAEANDELKKDEWFATSAHPLATFQSSAVKALGNNAFEVTGTLSIKGVSQNVTIPFTYAAQGDQGVFTGQFGFKRADFGIGKGPWGDFSIVANEVTIKFHVLAGR